jgi:hypothetical protein
MHPNQLHLPALFGQATCFHALGRRKVALVCEVFGQEYLRPWIEVVGHRCSPFHKSFIFLSFVQLFFPERFSELLNI